MVRAFLPHRQGQSEEQEGDRHVGRVRLHLGRVEDEREPCRDEAQGKRRPEPGRERASRGLPAERQGEEPSEEGAQPKRALALAEERDGGLLEDEPAGRGDLPIVERPEEISKRALDDVQGQVGLVGPQGRARPVLPQPEDGAEAAQSGREEPRPAGGH